MTDPGKSCRFNYSIVNRQLKNISLSDDLTKYECLNLIPCYPCHSGQLSKIQESEIHAFDPQDLTKNISKVCTGTPKENANHYSSTILTSHVLQWKTKPEENRRAFVFTLRDCPGFFLIKHFLSMNDQLVLANECLREYTRSPPYVSNLNVVKNHNPIKGCHVFDDKMQKINRITYTNLEHSSISLTEDIDHGQNIRKYSIQSPSPSGSVSDNSNCARGEIWPNSVSMFKKLRWTTFGFHYNWTERSYNKKHYTPMLIPLQQLTQEAVQLVSECTSTQLILEPYVPDVAILNFYHSRKDQLGGHRDDVEKSGNPLVSFSLGLPCLFSIQNSQTQSVMSFILQSGDVLILSTQARQFNHGVPKIFFHDPSLKKLNKKCLCQDFGHTNNMYNHLHPRNISLFDTELRNENDIARLLDTMNSCRINLSMRQYSSESEMMT